MHDGIIVVVTDVIAVCNVLSEVVHQIWADVLEVDPDEFVSVFATLLVPLSNSVTDFVNNLPSQATVRQTNVLSA